MKEARKKLEEFFPELLEVKEGSLILTPHWNILSQKYEEDIFNEYFVRAGKVITEYEDDFRCNVYDIDRHFFNYKVENEITLNYIIMYVQSKGVEIVSSTEFSLIFFGAVPYDLTRHFEGQSELFYEFINKL